MKITNRQKTITEWHREKLMNIVDNLD